MTHTTPPQRRTIHATDLEPKSSTMGYTRWVLCFGAYGSTFIMTDAPSLDQALDQCVDWIADPANHYTGLLANDQVAEAYQEALSGGKTEDEAWDVALVDVTTAGNCGDHLNSWEWGIACEDPTKEDLLRLAGAIS